MTFFLSLTSVDVEICLADYSYRDFKTIVRMINNSSEYQTQESLNRQEAAARMVVGFVLNKSDCRRVQLLQFFDEKFDHTKCQRRCDNCTKDAPVVEQDLTKESRDIVALVESFGTQNVTIDHCRAVYKGAKTDPVRKKGHDRLPLYGSGKHLPNDLMEQLFRRLCFLGITDENAVLGTNHFHTYYFGVRWLF